LGDIGKVQGTPGKLAVVENKPGAAPTLAASTAVSAPPDGHSQVVSTSTATAINPVLYKKVNYDAKQDLMPPPSAASRARRCKSSVCKARNSVAGTYGPLPNDPAADVGLNKHQKNRAGFHVLKIRDPMGGTS
jgi:hypothetical protein